MLIKKNSSYRFNSLNIWFNLVNYLVVRLGAKMRLAEIDDCDDKLCIDPLFFLMVCVFSLLFKHRPVILVIRLANR